MILKHRGIWFGLLLFSVVVTGCTVSYSFTGASIPIEAKTFTVEDIENVAPTINPTLASDLQLALVDRLLNQTRLVEAPYDGDLLFDVVVTGYRVTPISVSGGEVTVAEENRLTVTIKVKFKNRYDTKAEFEKSLSKFADYESSLNLTEVEDDLVADIIDQLIDDIFSTSVANW